MLAQPLLSLVESSDLTTSLVSVLFISDLWSCGNVADEQLRCLSQAGVAALRIWDDESWTAILARHVFAKLSISSRIEVKYVFSGARR